MCGICGKLNFDKEESVDLGLLTRMMELIHHRGPDAGGKFCSGSIALGHRRLSIIDLSTGAQPMSNEDGTVWVVYNGEIYNFIELRDRLQAKGHQFKSLADTEVIVHLYEEIGERALEHLQGMFAFALWDQRKQLLLLARDRVGIKPLYYTNTGKAMLFASEIKSLLSDPSVCRDINLKAIDRFLTYYYLPGEETLFKDIYKLLPGHYLTVRNGQSALHKYWDLSFDVSPQWSNFDCTVEALQDLVCRVVKEHMISDVPVGVLLSGGVDSTAILRYAVEGSKSAIHTFTIGFEGQDFADERPFAQLAAKTFSTRHYELTISSEDFVSFLPEYVWYMEEPVCEPPAVALYFVTKLARNYVKVVLSGEGGDEAFAGYPNYRNFFWLERLKRMVGPLSRTGSFLIDALSHVPGLSRLGRFSPLMQIPLEDYYLSRTSTPFTFFNRQYPCQYSDKFREELDKELACAPTRQMIRDACIRDDLNKMLYIDTKSWLPDDLLLKADKMTMANSVELRVPFLDHNVLEFAASLPPSYKLRGVTTKRILKAALKTVVPEVILNRKKTGFPVPYGTWLRGPLRPFVEDLLLSQRATDREYFGRRQIEELLGKHRNGSDQSKEVFSLLVLELWHQTFIDKDLVAREGYSEQSLRHAAIHT